jgi:hypothetical protein
MRSCLTLSETDFKSLADVLKKGNPLPQQNASAYWRGIVVQVQTPMPIHASVFSKVTGFVTWITRIAAGPLNMYIGIKLW